MVQITPNPIVLKDVTATIGADTFEKQLSQVVLTPTANAQKWRGLAPGATYSDIELAAWDAGLTFAQDHETPGSLSDYLFEQEGTKVTMILKPRSGSGPSYQVTVALTPGAIGGEVGAWATGTVTLPCDGKPIKIPAGAGIPVMGLADPATGPTAGGNLVKVTGSGFTGATAVHFGTVAATKFTIASPTLIVVEAPAAAAGSKPVKVTNASGQSTTTAPYSFA